MRQNDLLMKPSVKQKEYFFSLFSNILMSNYFSKQKPNLAPLSVITREP